MFTRDTYTNAKQVSTSSSTSLVILGEGYDGIIVTSTTTGAVTAYMPTLTDLQFDTGIVFPTMTAGTYKLYVGAIKCATGADAPKLVVFN